MSESTFDPKTIFENYRSAFAPALKAQQEGVKALDRMGRYQYAVAGDYLEWSLAQAKAAISAQSPVEFVTKQVELTTANTPGPTDMAMDLTNSWPRVSKRRGTRSRESEGVPPKDYRRRVVQARMICAGYR